MSASAGEESRWLPSPLAVPDAHIVVALADDAGALVLHIGRFFACCESVTIQLVSALKREGACREAIPLQHLGGAPG